ncbi:hypothetical protein K1T71_010360 [Dendrolimus kikuchii]|uniref:Uncharacterized protein n=1 Tax=Dendrolimus kikuchii TaxID=765133 RepID=A0ACC1CRB6_9NEOP|nr:hypothetical protein K1T71_010360 [Dendrolimus kikuchii]
MQQNIILNIFVVLNILILKMTKCCVKQNTYQLPTIQCFTCCRFGHVSDKCRSKPRCYKCGQLHSGNTCSVAPENAFLFDHKGINGGNTTNVPLECKIKNETFLIPPQSSFFCGCVKEQCKKLEGSKFDLVIADPPWWNKYIRRLKGANQKLSYSMMYNEDIASIPVKDLLSPNCLIAVWCTNSPSNTAAVKDLIFPSWGVEYVATWYWLKVTVDLEPICEFSFGSQKQPYERLILGKVGDVGKVPEDMLLVSIPSALHSHKPPLLDILSQYINNQNPRTLELFARYLLPNTTSIGYEPLKWQHISLYECVS